jgi:hypothetical protein
MLSLNGLSLGYTYTNVFIVPCSINLLHPLYPLAVAGCLCRPKNGAEEFYHGHCIPVGSSNDGKNKRLCLFDESLIYISSYPPLTGPRVLVSFNHGNLSSLSV